jgi:replicative DNA helicase
MKNKLTLRLEKDLIKEAKKYADEKGTSVSQLVADYFSLLKSQKTQSNKKTKIPPISSSLSGILKKSDLREVDYKTHLEEKYLK